MKKTPFKNNYLKYFEQIIDVPILGITTNKSNIIQIKYLKNDKEKLLCITANIERTPEGLLDFQFHFNAKAAFEQGLDSIIDADIKKIDEMNLFTAQDAFCKEQALEIRYDQDKYIHILIYTDMAEMTLEFFEEKLNAPKFKRIHY
jgi:hypothetical protein